MPTVACTLELLTSSFKLLATSRGHRPADSLSAFQSDSLVQALELFRELGDRHGQAGASINLGELLLLSLDYGKARSHFLQALSIARDIDTPVEEAQALREPDEVRSRKEIQNKAPKT